MIDHIIFYNFYLLLRKVYQLIKFIAQSYFFIAFEFIFINIYVFLKSLKKLQMACYKSLLSRFSVLINHTMWSFNLFTASSCFPYFSRRQGFSRSRFFRVQVFLGPGSRSSCYFIPDYPMLREKFSSA